jgi:GDP-mannose 6-dehydrogenase
MNLTVTVVGLGYVGCVIAATLAARGIQTHAVDVKREVVDALARGIAPIDEPDLAARIAEGLARGALHPTTDLALAVAASDLSLVCVGTPVGPDGHLIETDVLAACEAIARAVTAAARAHTIVIRSTVPAGLHERVSSQLREVAGGAFGDTLTLALNPEFLREGNAVHDVEHPELVVYATAHEVAAARLDALYEGHHDRLVRTEAGNAEVLKLVANVWHALKVSFANEVARIAAPSGVDAFAVMELLCRDKRLNTSAAYLRPGLPFGGACLTKDVSSLALQARARAVNAPIIASILPSNGAHVDHFVRAVLRSGPRRVAVVGIGFKPGAADVRDSAPVKLVLALCDAGVEVAVGDTAVLAARIPPLGILALRAALGDERAHAAPSIAAAIAGADVIVAAHPSTEDCLALVASRPQVPILDIAGELARRIDPGARAGLEIVEVLARGAGSVAPPPPPAPRARTTR